MQQSYSRLPVILEQGAVLLLKASTMYIVQNFYIQQYYGITCVSICHSLLTGNNKTIAEGLWKYSCLGRFSRVLQKLQYSVDVPTIYNAVSIVTVKYSLAVRTIYTLYKSTPTGACFLLDFKSHAHAYFLKCIVRIFKLIILNWFFSLF